MLEYLPRMTPELAAAIVDWRDSDSTISPSGAESETYGQMRPAYQCKNANFETTDELRLVAGATMEILSGEDANLNGIIDANETTATPRCPMTTATAGSTPACWNTSPSIAASRTRAATARRASTSVPGAGGGGGGAGAGAGAAARVRPNWPRCCKPTSAFARANEILARLGTQPIGSALEFYLRSQMRLEEFELIANDLTVTNSAIIGRADQREHRERSRAGLHPGHRLQQCARLGELPTVQFEQAGHRRVGVRGAGPEQRDPGRPHLTTARAISSRRTSRRWARMAAVTAAPVLCSTPAKARPRYFTGRTWTISAGRCGRDVRDFWLLAKDIRMNNLVNLDLLKRSRPSGLLGLALDGSRLEGVVLRRTNGSLQVQQSFAVTLSLDPLTNDPALVGREIRNQLDASGCRERHCVVGLPLKWTLVTHTQMPDLPEADVASFLQIEAERGFPCDVATLHLATSRYRLPSGEQHATLLGVPRNHVALLEQVLRRLN